ncbi:hypothetical protein BD410DRAFT_189970 [Rickenella mellea]|uniref:Uncharacterized protein n=1 Tax=Rickenella mellea TaxID=50990 RepID=A0A4Y7Q6P3_9AGAM|nr:hypothetical protein BD410DRAFT_189970 [Rickenella mellea]
MDDFMKRQAKPNPEEKRAILEQIQTLDPWYTRRHVKRFVERYWSRTTPENSKNGTEVQWDAATGPTGTIAIKTISCESLDASDEAINASNEVPNEVEPSITPGRVQILDLSQPTRAMEALDDVVNYTHTPSREPELEVSTVVLLHPEALSNAPSPLDEHVESDACVLFTLPSLPVPELPMVPVGSNRQAISAKDAVGFTMIDRFQCSALADNFAQDDNVGRISRYPFDSNY